MAPEASVVHAGRIAERAGDYAEETRFRLEFGFAIPAAAYVRAQQFRRYLGGRFLSALERVDAILSPSLFGVAPVEEAAPEGGEWFDEMDYLAPYNLTGLPAVFDPLREFPGGTAGRDADRRRPPCRCAGAEHRRRLRGADAAAGSDAEPPVVLISRP